MKKTLIALAMTMMTSVPIFSQGGSHELTDGSEGYCCAIAHCSDGCTIGCDGVNRCTVGSTYVICDGNFISC